MTPDYFTKRFKNNKCHHTNLKKKLNKIQKS